MFVLEEDTECIPYIACGRDVFWKTSGKPTTYSPSNAWVWHSVMQLFAINELIKAYEWATSLQWVIFTAEMWTKSLQKAAVPQLFK